MNNQDWADTAAFCGLIIGISGILLGKMLGASLTIYDSASIIIFGVSLWYTSKRLDELENRLKVNENG